MAILRHYKQIQQENDGKDMIWIFQRKTSTIILKLDKQAGFGCFCLLFGKFYVFWKKFIRKNMLILVLNMWLQEGIRVWYFYLIVYEKDWFNMASLTIYANFCKILYLVNKNDKVALLNYTCISKLIHTLIHWILSQI